MRHRFQPGMIHEPLPDLKMLAGERTVDIELHISLPFAPELLSSILHVPPYFIEGYHHQYIHSIIILTSCIVPHLVKGSVNILQTSFYHDTGYTAPYSTSSSLQYTGTFPQCTSYIIFEEVSL